MYLSLSRLIVVVLTLASYLSRLVQMSAFSKLKRGFDIVFSLFALTILLPIFVIIVIVMKIGSKGPSVFKQERAGKHGEPFVLYKFRTMKIDVDPFGSSPKSGKDPRLTKFGKILREFSLDELPQLYNVLTGDMSVVGPRPLYISQISEWSERHKKRLLVKPGLTGLAQIEGRGGITREEKLELDVKYVETACFLVDIKIILATVAHVFRRKDVYEKRYSQNEYTRGAKS
jgi:undecaprenyl phosphate N,N'-diacetylbacillosamine 1-phosphate transferase